MTNDDREDSFSARFLKSIRENYKPPTPELEMLFAQGLRNSKVEAEAIVKISSSPDTSRVKHSPASSSDKGSETLSETATLPQPDISHSSTHLISASNSATTMSPYDPSISVILGTTTDNLSLRIGDLERRNGLYILGKPRMGKSWLIVNMILQDIENGHGVFFIDPHGDAIDEIVSRRIIVGTDRLLIELDNPACSCGINILACPDITDPKLRADTFARVKGFFDKIWKNTFEDRPWLQLILQNTIYAFIENQGYTLAEFPMFFSDKEFRELLCGNIKYNDIVRHYWLKTFASKNKRDQDAQMEAAQTRLEILLAHPFVRHIVGQQKSTIDFKDILKSNKVVLLKLSSAMSIEDKTIIGTLFVSELLSAIQKRPADNRNLFSIYIDEFQNFASFDDFATLITNAPKCGITTTLAHHDRYGQLGDDKQIIGATAAIINKVLFQLTGKDARELALEFARDPQADQYIISQQPVRELLEGHDDPRIRELVDLHLRPLKEKLEDTRDLMEGERLIRTDLLDEAALARIDERIDWVEYGGRSSDRILGLAQDAIGQARLQTGRIQGILDLSMNMKTSLRYMDRFFKAVMEGRVSKGTEAYSDFLIGRVRDCAFVPEPEATILELYISLVFGDANNPRVLPVPFVRRYALWNPREIQRRLEDKYASEFLLRHEKSEVEKHSRENESINKALGYIYDNMKGFRTWNRGEKNVSEEVFKTYILLKNYPSLADLLTPYLAARFRGPWEKLEKVYEREIVQFFIKQMTEQSYEFERVKEPVLKEAESFVRRSGEGAMVATTLLNTGLGLWTKDLSAGYNPVPPESRPYRSMHMLEMPAIVGKEPLEILLFIKKLNDVLVTIIPGAGAHFARVYEYNPNTYGEENIKGKIDLNFYLRCEIITPWDLFKARDAGPGAYEDQLGREKEEVADWLLSEVNRVPEGFFDPDTARLWGNLDEFTRAYLIARACDTVWFGERVAKYSYPQPSIPGATSEQVARMVSRVITMAERKKGGRKKAQEEKEKSRFLSYVQKTVAETHEDLEETVKELRPQVLTRDELERVKEACSSEIASSPSAAKMLQVVNSFVELCELLAKPENYIKVRAAGTGAVRNEADMVNEMARVLTESPKYTAYAKVLQGKEMWKGRIITHPLPDNGFKDQGMPMFIPSMYPAIWKERTWIESEMQRRQIEWKQNKPAQGTEKPVASKGKPSKPGKPPTDEPPPIRY